MDKLKEIFHKIKTTEIKFKKPDFIAHKEKTSAKNISEETLLRANINFICCSYGYIFSVLLDKCFS